MMFFGDTGNGCDIGHGEQRIGRAFDECSLDIGSNSAFELIEIGRIDNFKSNIKMICKLGRLAL